MKILVDWGESIDKNLGDGKFEKKLITMKKKLYYLQEKFRRAVNLKKTKKCLSIFVDYD